MAKWVKSGGYPMLGRQGYGFRVLEDQGSKIGARLFARQSARFGTLSIAYWLRGTSISFGRHLLGKLCNKPGVNIERVVTKHVDALEGGVVTGNKLGDPFWKYMTHP